MGTEDADRLRKAGLLFSVPKDPALLAGGIGRDWPHARGVFETGLPGVAVLVNDAEHLTVVSSARDGDLKATFAGLCQVRNTLTEGLAREGLDYAWDERLGYLLALPEQLGAALSIRVQMKAPLLGKQGDLTGIVKSNRLALVSCRQGVLEVSNRETFGLSESDIINLVIEGCAMLVQAEAALERGEPLPGFPKSR